MGVKKRNKTSGSHQRDSANPSSTAPIDNDNKRDSRQPVPPESPASPPAAKIMDPQEAARIIRAKPVDPSTNIVRCLAIFRFFLFLMLVYVSVAFFLLVVFPFAFGECGIGKEKLNTDNANIMRDVSL